MGTRSSKYTGFTSRKADPRVLSDNDLHRLKSLVLTDGVWDPALGARIPAPTSTRRERRDALRRLRAHVKVKLGRYTDYGRIHIPPKFPNRHSPNDPT